MCPYEEVTVYIFDSENLSTAGPEASLVRRGSTTSQEQTPSLLKYPEHMGTKQDIKMSDIPAKQEMLDIDNGHSNLFLVN